MLYHIFLGIFLPSLRADNPEEFELLNVCIVHCSDGSSGACSKATSLPKLSDRQLLQPESELSSLSQLGTRRQQMMHSSWSPCLIWDNGPITDQSPVPQSDKNPASSLGSLPLRLCLGLLRKTNSKGRRLNSRKL